MSAKQIELQKKLDDMRHQVQLLDSHKTVGLINDKQYNDSLGRIVEQIEEIEEEYGLAPYIFTADDLLFGNGAERFAKELLGND